MPATAAGESRASARKVTEDRDKEDRRIQIDRPRTRLQENPREKRQRKTGKIILEETIIKEAYPETVKAVLHRIARVDARRAREDRRTEIIIAAIVPRTVKAAVRKGREDRRAEMEETTPAVLSRNVRITARKGREDRRAAAVEDL